MISSIVTTKFKLIASYKEEFINLSNSVLCLSRIWSSSVFSTCILIFFPVITLLLTLGLSLSSSEDESSRLRFSFLRCFLLSLLRCFRLLFLEWCLLVLYFFECLRDELLPRLPWRSSSDLSSSLSLDPLESLMDRDLERRVCLCFLFDFPCRREPRSLIDFLELVLPRLKLSVSSSPWSPLQLSLLELNELDRNRRLDLRLLLCLLRFLSSLLQLSLLELNELDRDRDLRLDLYLLLSLLRRLSLCLLSDFLLSCAELLSRQFFCVTSSSPEPLPPLDSLFDSSPSILNQACRY